MKTHTDHQPSTLDSPRRSNAQYCKNRGVACTSSTLTPSKDDPTRRLPPTPHRTRDMVTNAQSSKAGPTVPPLKMIGDYELHRSLGSGSTGKVKLGIHRKTGEKIAVKIVARSNARFAAMHSTASQRDIEKIKAREESRELRAIREAHIMRLLDHPHIVNLRDLIVTSNHLYILMDYVKGGQLLQYIIKHRRLSEQRARQFAKQIASALDYLHRNSIVHRDLKIENILLDEAGTQVKIVDFGLSNLFCPESLLETYCGSLYFAAPELLSAQPYHGPEIDVWSFGVVIYVMVTGSVPFDDNSIPCLHEKIKRARVAYPACLSDDCRDLLSRIFVPDPSKRILLADVLHHPWILGNDKSPVDNYLPVREPLTWPLDQRVIHRMSGQLGLGTAKDINDNLQMILQSNVYREAVHRASWYPTMMEHPPVHPPSPPLSCSSSTRGAIYTDPQSIPAAYHPLLSIYYLTRERLDKLCRRNNQPTAETYMDDVTPASPSPMWTKDCTSVNTGNRENTTFKSVSTSVSMDRMTRIHRWLSAFTSSSPSSSSSRESTASSQATACIPSSGMDCKPSKHEYNRFKVSFPKLIHLFSRRRSKKNNPKDNAYKMTRQPEMPSLSVVA